MAQLTVTFTLDDSADRFLLKRMLNDMKGVLFNNVTIHEEPATRPTAKTNEWIEKMRNFSNSVDNSYIDLEDDRTRYIMSK